MTTLVFEEAPSLPRLLDLGPALEVAAASVREGVLPSAVFGVADSRGVVGVRAVSGPDRVVSEHTIFFLASVTKPIVATALMQYVDEGRLDVHAPIARYVPEFAGPEHRLVTPWHILTHSSGLPDSPIEGLLRDRPSYAEVLRRVLDCTPDFEPGARFSYASSPWMLLSETMSRLSGRSFADALRLRLTGPLAMDDTTFDARHARGRVAPLHGLRIRNRLVEEVLVRFMARAMLPGGGMFSTLTDLLTLGRALLPVDNRRGGELVRVLTQRGIDEMTRLQTVGLLETLEDGSTREARHALGWAKPRPGLPGSPSAFTHGGAAGARLWVDPERDLVFAFLTNLWGAPDEPAYATLEAVYGAWGSADQLRPGREGPRL